MNDKVKSFFDSMKAKFHEKCTFEKISMDANNRMLRIGVGLNDGHKSFRLDLWSVGYRINSRSKKEQTLNGIDTRLPASKVYCRFKVDKIPVDQGNTVVRIGYGKHKGTNFFRIDLWSMAYRVTKNSNK